jgi:hypothetical protein
MNTLAKGALATVLALVVLPLGAFTAYDLLVFQPRMPAIRALLRDADPENRHPPAHVVRYLSVPDGHVQSGQVMRVVLWRVYPGPGNRHATQALWAALVSLHLDEGERVALLASLSWNGVDDGLDRDARRRFGKPLHALTARESAIVVANLHGPTTYKHSPELLARRADYLQQRAGGARIEREVQEK